MDGDQARVSSRPVQAALWVLVLLQAPPALWALLAPRSFYAGFPGAGRAWVAAYPPYNHHLITDYGAGFLAVAVLAAAAAVLMERRVIQVAMVCWMVAALPHFGFHLATTGGIETIDAVGTLVALGLAFGVPAAILLALRRQPAPGRAAAGPARARPTP